MTRSPYLKYVHCVRHVSTRVKGASPILLRIISTSTAQNSSPPNSIEPCSACPLPIAILTPDLFREALAFESERSELPRTASCGSPHSAEKDRTDRRTCGLALLTNRAAQALGRAMERIRINRVAL